MTAWRDLFAVAENKMDAEDKYFGLLRRADAMELAELITGDEWVRLVKEAGTLLASSAECMGGKGNSAYQIAVLGTYGHPDSYRQTWPKKCAN
eukprot:gene6190-7171_t